jgi:hypothetical protein
MLKYLSKIDKARSVNKSHHINDRQAFILDYICKQYLVDKACRINEIISLKTVGSQATLHAITKQLAKLKLIEINMDLVNNRVKNVLPTYLALKRLKTLVTIFQK